MKKQSKTLRKDYSRLEGRPLTLEYFGVLMKEGRARIDTKRFRKFFALPDEKIEHRSSIYYLPAKMHRNEYMSNLFFDLVQELKRQWYQEYRPLIEKIKTPEEAEKEAFSANLCDGVLDYDEAMAVGTFAKMKRQAPYKKLVKTICAQFFQTAMSQIDALTLKVLVMNGYQNDKFSREEFDTFIQGKQGKRSVKFYDFKYYSLYDRAYRVWNFLKHNSTKAYTQLKKWHSETIYDPNGSYENGDSALSVLKLDERLMLKSLDELPLFFDEVCERGFGENAKDARWDYDDYFIEQAESEIENIENPLGLPAYL